MEDARLTPKPVLPGEMYDVEEMDRALREMDKDLERMSLAEFSAWVASLEAEDREMTLALMSDAEYAALENWEPDMEDAA